MSTWETQRRHSTTHNLFQSAVIGEEGPGIIDEDFRVVGEYNVIPDTRNDIDIEPPYTLLGRTSAIFFDFITPGSIEEDEIDRIDKYNHINMRSVENHLNRAPISEDFLDPDEVEWYDHCTILREDQYREHNVGSAEERQRIRELEETSSLATVSKGGELSLEATPLRDDDLCELLENGIPVPDSPANLVYLTREIHDESLVLGICEEIVLGSDLSESGVALDFEDVKDDFNRGISYEQLEDAFEYLRDIGACRKRREDGKYLFTKYNLPTIMGVRDRFENETVEERVSDSVSETGNAELSEFAEASNESE
ncbi:hypothetical protein ABNG03_10135 [Halorubrum sp. RMP-47]|uniref:Uncharacterized protein n=1 Tax=Halorubrum miltondacostae TaxID=3076378 RepID=A0ABD5LWU6_9EURY